MKDNFLIVLMTVIWLVLVMNIIWQHTEGKWNVEDAEKIGSLEVAKYTNQVIVVAVSDEEAKLCFYEYVLHNENADIEEKSGGSRIKMYRKGILGERQQGEEEQEELLQGEDMREKEVQKEMQQGDKLQKGEWKLVLETDAVIGINGLGKKREGDGKTPIGVFGFMEAFGIMENPGTEMEYTQVDERHYWVDDSNSNYYNQFVSIDEVEIDWESAEHICEYEESYDYVLATSYNAEGIPGVGSAVFLHCTEDDSDATAGCIAIPKMFMKEIIRRVEPQCVMVVDYRENILDY